MSFVIHTDSCCDIHPDLLKEWGVFCTQLRFRFEGSEQELTNRDMDEYTFYNKMREGGIAKTSAANIADFKADFETLLKEGKDVLCLAFSSGLSTTCNSAKLAAVELMEQYPERTITVIDTLAASAGQGLLVKLAVDKAATGATLAETAAYIEEQIPHLAHWFTVDDLVYLKRGGRVSPTVAFVGNMLSIKPVLHVDDEGHLINISKVRGRKASIQALAKKFEETALDNTTGPIFISHGDCIEDAEALAAIVEQKHGVKTEIITLIGPVIGAHSGPGTLAIFFLAKQK
ncbi:MAG: DegV family protein [Clostridia bacterium]|nr:DegV family protein [Clostridia bacterium]